MDDRRTRSGRKALSLTLLLACALLVSCGSSVANNVKARPLAGLLVICEPADASIYVDDRYMGSVKGLSRKPLLLPPGDHRVEVRRDGFFAHFSEVKVVNGVRQQLKVKLRKEPF